MLVWLKNPRKVRYRTFQLRLAPRLQKLAAEKAALERELKAERARAASLAEARDAKGADIDKLDDVITGFRRRVNDSLVRMNVAMVKRDELQQKVDRLEREAQQWTLDASARQERYDQGHE